GYKEEGTTTTPFDMVMLNDLDRFHLVIDVIDRVPGLMERAAHLRQHMVDERLRHRAYTREHGEDPNELRNWTWPRGDGVRGAGRIDAGVERALRELSDLAPLHQQKSLAALDAVTALLPRLPAVACFDTAFHASLPEVAATYALPAAWRDRWGLRRYGFHGLSHAWIARRPPQLLRQPADQL